MHYQKFSNDAFGRMTKVAACAFLAIIALAACQNPGTSSTTQTSSTQTSLQMYVAGGNGNGQPAYWKNGTSNILRVGSGDTTGLANGVTFTNGDLYVTMVSYTILGRLE